MSDFSDKPLVAGSLIGLRAFDVDRLGRLVSPSYPTIFTPGENVAECKKREDYFAAALSRSLVALNTSFATGGYIRGADLPVTLPSVSHHGLEPKKPTHTAGILDCQCGWYAYFDGGNDFKNSARISAIVEGWGVCTLGTRGFRAEKMRLVALVAPGRKSELHDDEWSRVEHNYDVPVYARKSLALDAHPLTPPAIPTPESADDFWTRSAR